MEFGFPQGPMVHPVDSLVYYYDITFSCCCGLEVNAPLQLLHGRNLRIDGPMDRCASFNGLLDRESWVKRHKRESRRRRTCVTCDSPLGRSRIKC